MGLANERCRSDGSILSCWPTEMVVRGRDCRMLAERSKEEDWAVSAGDSWCHFDNVIVEGRKDAHPWKVGQKINWEQGLGWTSYSASAEPLLRPTSHFSRAAWNYNALGTINHPPLAWRGVLLRPRLSPTEGIQEAKPKGETIKYR